MRSVRAATSNTLYERTSQYGVPMVAREEVVLPFENFQLFTKIEIITRLVSCVDILLAATTLAKTQVLQSQRATMACYTRADLVHHTLEDGCKHQEIEHSVRRKKGLWSDLFI